MQRELELQEEPTRAGGRAMDDSGITQALPVLSERLQKKSRWGADRRREEASCRLCTGLSPEGIWGP